VEAPLAMVAPVSASSTPSLIAPVAPIAAAATIAEPIAPSVPEPKVATPAKEDSKPVDANAWLLEQNPEVFVLQLGSSPKLEGLDPTLKKMRNPDSSRMLSINTNGTHRFILVTGPFETREEAKKAADQARVELGITAWMRKVSDVKALLERQQ
jgi:septal ring-binding cell division protein DamX